MKVELTPLENRILKVIVEATPEELEQAKRTAAQRLGKRVHIPGFRPGKAPYPILLKHLDPVLLQEETIETFLDQYYPEILEKENIKPYSPGELKSILNLEPLTLEIHIPLEPIVELGDYHSIRIPYEPPVVTDNDVDEAIDRLRQQNAVLEPADRPIQEGDLVYIDLVGYQKENGEVTDQAILDQEDFPVQLSSDQKDVPDYPFDGFSMMLIGKKVNDQFTVDFSYPEDSPNLMLKGKDVHFQVTIKDIKSRVLPELNDEFAQSIGEFSTLEELKKYVRESLEKETIDTYHQEYDKKALEEVINISKIEYPPEYIDMEREAYLEDLRRLLSRMNIDLEIYKKMVGEETFNKEVEEQVNYRLKSTLTLMELAKQEKITVDFAMVREKTQQVMQNLRERLQDVRVPKKFLEDTASRVTTNHIFNQVFESTYERLRKIAKGEAENEIINSSQEDQEDLQPTSTEEGNDKALDTEPSIQGEPDSKNAE